MLALEPLDWNDHKHDKMISEQGFGGYAPPNFSSFCKKGRGRLPWTPSDLRNYGVNLHKRGLVGKGIKQGIQIRKRSKTLLRFFSNLTL